MILDAWGWCTGTTQREGMGREEGEGFRLGNTGIIGILNLKILIAKFELSGQTNAKTKQNKTKTQAHRIRGLHGHSSLLSLKLEQPTL